MFFFFCLFAQAFLLAKVTDAVLRLLDFALDDGHLLSPYYAFISQWEETHPKRFKVLGGCMVCSGFWVSLLLLAAYCWLLPGSFPWGIVFFYQPLALLPTLRRVRKQQAAKQAAEQGT